MFTNKQQGKNINQIKEITTTLSLYLQSAGRRSFYFNPSYNFFSIRLHHYFYNQNKNMSEFLRHQRVNTQYRPSELLSPIPFRHFKCSFTSRQKSVEKNPQDRIFLHFPKDNSRKSYNQNGPLSTPRKQRYTHFPREEDYLPKSKKPTNLRQKTQYREDTLNYSKIMGEAPKRNPDQRTAVQIFFSYISPSQEVATSRSPNKADQTELRQNKNIDLGVKSCRGGTFFKKRLKSSKEDFEIKLKETSATVNLEEEEPLCENAALRARGEYSQLSSELDELLNRSYDIKMGKIHEASNNALKELDQLLNA